MARREKTLATFGGFDIDRITLVAAGSIAVAGAVLALKYVAYRMTGSVALYSDALESIVNLVTAVAALFAIRVSSLPADKNHPFGHHKAEYFSAVLEGVLIVVAALLIFREALGALLAPRTLEGGVVGLAYNGAATVLNAVWSWFLITHGRQWRSPALVADGWHLFTDVLTSVGVLGGLTLAMLTGITILDPLLACAVGLYILWSGYRIAASSMSGLMDEAVGSDIERRIREAIRQAGEGALQAHEIRTRRAARATFIEFHLVVPGSMTVEEAHRICDRLEIALEDEIEGSDVVIHVEPEHKAVSKGAVKL